MKKLIITFSIIILFFSLTASLAGVLSYGHDESRMFTTVRGEAVKIEHAGVYRYSLQALVVSGIPWDFVRLFVGIPIFFVSFLLYRRGSLRGTVLFIGSLANFLYQYLLWTFDWAYNSLFLVYVTLFSLSLWTLMFVIVSIDQTKFRTAIKERFPVRTIATFSFAAAVLLFFKCIGEIMPTFGSNQMPITATGYYTLVDQALDLGLLAPFCITTGVLLLRGKSLGFLLSSSSLVIFLNIGLSVVVGEFMLGLSTGRINIVGIAVFTIFMAVGLTLLISVLKNIKRMNYGSAVLTRGR